VARSHDGEPERTYGKPVSGHDDEDSRRAYATWEAVRAQAAQLRRLLGDDYDRLVYAS